LYQAHEENLASRLPRLFFDAPSQAAPGEISSTDLPVDFVEHRRKLSVIDESAQHGKN
jgi:hypothetical protein